MRLKTPRLAPLGDGELSPEAAEVLAPVKERGADYAIFRTFAHHPKALARFLAWGRYILSENSLAPRQREMAILRAGFLCRSGYEWAQHVVIGKRAGLTDAEIAGLKMGAGFGEADAALIAAVDELIGDHFISDGTWARLCRHFSEEQRIDLIFTVGQYAMVSSALNSLGVQLDAGLVGDPDLERAP